MRKQRATWGFFKEWRPQLYTAITRPND